MEFELKLTFIYFDFPFWRAEIVRIALYYGDIKFDDLRITREEFLRTKKNGYLDDGTIIPFHQFPCLVVDGVPIAQTGGIARFCGKQSGLYPNNNDLSATGTIEDVKKRKAAREELSLAELPRKLKMWERSIDENSDWLVENDISIADLATWRLMGWLSSGTLDGIPTDLLKPFPKIRRICQAVDMHPKVQEWVGKTYPANYQRGNYL